MGGLSSRYQSYVWKLFFCSSNFWVKGWSCFSEIIFKYFTISPKANKSIEGKIDTAQARITASNTASDLWNTFFAKIPSENEVINATIIYNPTENI